jgi:hypothetical protein
MANSRVGGIIFVKLDGVALRAKGSFTINPGIDKKEMIVGMDGVHGYKQTPQAAKISGAITDDSDLDVEALYKTVDATVTVELANGKVFVCEKAAFTGEGDATTEEGEISVEFEGFNGRYIK